MKETAHIPVFFVQLLPVPQLPGLSNGHSRCWFLLGSHCRHQLLFFHCQFLDRGLFATLGRETSAQETWVVDVLASESGCQGEKGEGH